MMTVLAIADPDKGPKGTSRFLVDRRDSSFRVKDYPMIGYRIVPVSELTFKGCKVPKENLLGGPGKGLQMFYKAMEASRAMQFMGAYGLTEEAGVERFLRDAQMLTIQDGTTEIMKLIVGRDLTGLRAFS